MKTKIWLILLLGELLNFPTSNFGNVDISPGFKIGINNNKLSSLDGGIGIHGLGFPKYSYPIGFITGTFIELKFSDHISIVNEFSYKNKLSKLKVYTGEENILNQQLTVNYFSVSCLIKIKHEQNFIPYLLAGLDFGYLLRGEYKFLYPVTNYSRGSYEITDDLPSFNSSIKVGIGKKFDLFKNICLICEAAGLIGLKQQKYFYIGKWKNNGLQFMLGIQYE